MRLPDFLTDHPDGDIRLTGHRIGLYHIVSAYEEGRTPGEIAGRFPTLDVDLINDVIGFYQRDRAEVDSYVAAYRDDLRRQREAAPPSGPGLAELQRRARAARQEPVP